MHKWRGTNEIYYFKHYNAVDQLLSYVDINVLRYIFSTEKLFIFFDVLSVVYRDS